MRNHLRESIGPRGTDDQDPPEASGTLIDSGQLSRA
jgi:hypothetical protein